MRYRPPLALLMLAWSGLSACPKPAPLAPEAAIAALTDGRGRIVGSVEVHPGVSGLQLIARVYSLPKDRTYDLALHEGGSCEGEGFEAVGPPWTPPGSKRPTRFGPLQADPRGRAALRASDPGLTLTHPANGVIGRSIVLVPGEDDVAPHACGVFTPPVAQEIRVGGEQPQMTEAWEL